MLHYRYRDYRTMRHPGREMSDPSDLIASQWLTQICGLGRPVAVTSKGPPRQISQQMDCGPRHRRQRRAELTACREMVLRERVPEGRYCVQLCYGPLPFCFARRTRRIRDASRTEAISLLGSNLVKWADSSNDAGHPVGLQRRE